MLRILRMACSILSLDMGLPRRCGDSRPGESRLAKCATRPLDRHPGRRLRGALDTRQVAQMDADVERTSISSVPNSSVGNEKEEKEVAFDLLEATVISYVLVNLLIETQI